VVEVGITDEAAQHLKKLFETNQRDIMHEWKLGKRRPENHANAPIVERKATPSVLVKICSEIAKFKQHEQRNGEGSFLVAVKILALAPVRW